MREVWNNPLYRTIFWVAITLILIVAGSLYWQRVDTERQQFAEQQSENIYISSAAEFTIRFPTTWASDDFSDAEDGIVRLELVGPDNKTVEAKFKKRLLSEFGKQVESHKFTVRV